LQLGLTWPLQRLLKVSVPYGDTIERGFCWDAHCITLYGRSSLLLVHCQSRYTLVLFDMTPMDWRHLSEIAAGEIHRGLLDAGIDAQTAAHYLSEAGAIHQTRTHGRREVAFLNRAWEAVLAADLSIDPEHQQQPALNSLVNMQPCRCAGYDGIASAQAHIERYFIDFRKEKHI